MTSLTEVTPPGRRRGWGECGGHFRAPADEEPHRSKPWSPPPHRELCRGTFRVCFGHFCWRSWRGSRNIVGYGGEGRGLRCRWRSCRRCRRATFRRRDPGGPGAAPACAVIMDGNGRWATSRGLPRVAGHGEGVKAVPKHRAHRGRARGAVPHPLRVLLGELAATAPGGLHA